jgi:hypothetical protein
VAANLIEHSFTDHEIKSLESSHGQYYINYTITIKEINFNETVSTPLLIKALVLLF